MVPTTPRGSGPWAYATGANSQREEEDNSDDLEHQPIIAEDEGYDPGTPLDKTIDRIGMGSYQWTLLSLCGFGWLADNMWIQAVAIILPRVQQHYSVPDGYIGIVSFSMFAGMMFGAIGWGTCSDLMGRSTAFNATLFFTSLFGLLASFTNSFPALCVNLFFLGSAVGGSMPTDGTLILEHMPRGKRYYVTALSVFFSLGSVLAAAVALLVVPQHSCPPAPAACNVAIQNQGWKYLLIALGSITLSMFLARIVFFRLHESPRYLVHAGRPQEALLSLQMISRFNGSNLMIDLDDVDDHRPPTRSPLDDDDDVLTPFMSNGREETHFHAYDRNRHDDAQFSTTLSADQEVRDANVRESSTTQTIINGHPTSPQDIPSDQTSSRVALPFLSLHLPSRGPPRSQPPLRTRSSGSPLVDRSHVTDLVPEKHLVDALPRWMHKPLRGWLDRLGMVLSPVWFKTTMLVWSTWCAMALAYTMFNVYLPKLLETNPGPGNSGAPSLNETLWDVLVYTIGGCPGALLGAYLVESRLGRRWSLAGSTFGTALLCMAFVMVESPLAIRVSTVGISLASTTMWAVLYGWTPEIFGTKVRGTACGAASAFSRIGGMTAPILGGVLLMVHRSVPVYTSGGVFFLAGIFVLSLKEDRQGNEGVE